jgi:AbrB family looped-hinge helix DNA binding protein
MLISSKAGCPGFRRSGTLNQFSSFAREDRISIGRPLPEYQANGIIRHSGGRKHQMESARVGKRGAIIVPARLRKRFGIEEGSLVVAEEKDDGILIRPAVLVPVERYNPERKAEFLLSTATTDIDYRKARRAVRRLGVDPDSVPHRRP